MKSYVYFISDGTFYKIGKANDLEKRLSYLQVGSSSQLQLFGYIECESSEIALFVEKELHEIFLQRKVRGEWFAITDLEIMDMLDAFDGIPCDDSKWNDYLKCLYQER